jgi:hypothetical protein
MKSKPEELIAKAEAQAAAERASGNQHAGDVASFKAQQLRKKYNLPVPEPVKEQPASALEKQIAKLAKMLPDAQVVVDVLLPGMVRTVQRVLDIETALPLLRSGSAIFVRIVNGDNAITFAPPEEVAEPSVKREKLLFI